MPPLLVAVVATAAAATGAAACSTDLDCSLNGACTAGACECAAPWHGPGCELLRFRPSSFPQGYGMAPNLTTWGGGAIYDTGTKKYHSYISSMTNDCGLETYCPLPPAPLMPTDGDGRRWTQNSRIEHGVADTVTGPYKFVDVAVPTWSHNAAPIALHDGTFAIVHIGGGNGAADGGRNCTCEKIPGGCPPPPPPPPCPAGSDIPGYRCYTAACAAKTDCAGDHCNCGDDLGEPKLSPCHSQSSCAAEAARACDAHAGCDKFTLRSSSVKLFSNASHFVPNKDWTGYVKVGSAADLQLQEATEAPAPATTAGSTIHVAKSLDGPWEPLSPNTLGEHGHLPARLSDELCSSHTTPCCRGLQQPGALGASPQRDHLHREFVATTPLVDVKPRSDDACLAGLRQLAQALREHLRPVARGHQLQPRRRTAGGVRGPLLVHRRSRPLPPHLPRLHHGGSWRDVYELDGFSARLLGGWLLMCVAAALIAAAS